MIFLLASLAFAEEPVYTNLKKGDVAPFDGRLFNDAAVTEIITERKLKDLDCDLEIEYQVDIAATKSNYEYELLQAKYRAEVSKLKDVNEIKQEELNALRLTHKPVRPYFWLTGGFVMGTATAITIFKTVEK